MKHPIVNSHTFARFTARLTAIVLFGALLLAVPFHAAFAQTAPDLGSAASFAVLAGPAVTCTDSTINGDVGSGLTGADQLHDQWDGSPGRRDRHCGLR